MLSSDEVSVIYNSGNSLNLLNAGPIGNIIGYWKVTNNSFPAVYDRSVYENDGVMLNMEQEDIVLFSQN